MDRHQELRDSIDKTLEKKLFFVGGQAKSGTTWLQLIIDNHPRASCKGEGHFGDILAQSLAQGVNQYNAAISQSDRIFHELEGYPRLQNEHLNFLTRTAIGCLLAQQTADGEVDAIGERTPANLQHLQQLNLLFPDARFIHIIRDIRDVTVSFWVQGQRTYPDWLRKEFGSLSGVAEKLAPAWVNAIEKTRQFAQRHPDRVLEVRYEDLHQEAFDTINRVFNFLDIEASDEIIEACQRRTEFSRLSGGRKKGQEDKSSHFRKGKVGDWKTELDERSVAIIEQHAGETLQKLGYH